jgi:hypothetical protein
MNDEPSPKDADPVSRFRLREHVARRAREDNDRFGTEGCRPLEEVRRIWTDYQHGRREDIGITPRERDWIYRDQAERNRRESEAHLRKHARKEWRVL